MPSRTHYIRLADAVGDPVTTAAVTLWVERTRDGAAVVGSELSPVSVPHVGAGRYEHTTGQVYDAGEEYRERWSVTPAGGTATESALAFEVDEVEPATRWLYADWITLGTEAERLAQLRRHIHEYAEAIDADTAADGLSANHATLQRELDALRREEQRLEARVAGSPSRTRVRFASFRRP